MKKWVGVLAGVALLLVVAWRISAKVKLDKEVAARAEQVAVPTVKTTSPVRKQVAGTVKITGTVRSEHEVDVVSRAMGPLVAVKATLGEAVTEGQVLALVEQDTAAIQLRQASAALEAAQANLANAQSNATSAEALSKSQNIADVQLVAARSGLQAARAQVRQAQAQVAMAKENLNNTRITSPIDGVVTRRTANVGQMVGGGPAPLFRVEDLKHLKLDTSIDEKEVTLVRVGQQVEFTVDAYPDKTFTGTVSRLSPSLDATSRRAAVEVSVENPDGLLYTNMFASGKIGLSETREAIVVPAQALVAGMSTPAVYVLEGQVAKLRPVVTGTSDGQEVIITQGLTEQDTVVTAGQGQLSDGITVSVQNGIAAQ